MSREGRHAKPDTAHVEDHASLLKIVPVRSAAFSDVNLDDSPR